ncbi:MAG: tripartite tricarboxylate transporter substrate binding protein [Burkholderiaceae bacterium]|nr:tripartite tricarboxylate transporter substrate binding protein [Burkholderiaceae bacterium]
MIQHQRRRLLAAMGAAAAAASLPRLAHAAEWPDKPVNIIVPFPPGGPVDVTARFVAMPMGQRWKVPTVVDNKAGAGGIVGAQAAARMAPDGYGLFMAAIHHTVLPALRNDLTYDITKDFVPVGLAASFPIILVVHPSVPADNLQAFIAYAKANPGKLSFGSSGTGGGTHLAGELFNKMAGTSLQHVPYRGSAPAMQDLLGGQVQVMFADGPSAVPHIKAGKVRALGVGNPEPSPLAPDVPTIASSGVPGYEAYSWAGLLAPVKTPAAVIKRINADLNAVLKDPEVARAMLGAGAEPRPGTPEEFGQFIDEELNKWRRLIKDAGITIQT